MMRSSRAVRGGLSLRRRAVVAADQRTVRSAPRGTSGPATARWDPCSTSIANPHHSQALRAFSSKPEAKPTVFDGFAGLSEFAGRVRDRVSQFERYQEHNVFPPAMNLLSRYLLFARLQLPTQTQVDAVEFLGGAQHAVDLALHTMFSHEVANYAFGEIPESPATQTLQKIMSPMCFDMFFQGLKAMKGTLRTMEMNDLDIKGVHLAGVTWEKLALAEIKQQEKDDLVSTHELIKARFLLESMTQNPTKTPGAIVLQGAKDINSIVIEDSDYETMVERLRLDVVTETTESVTTSTYDGEGEAQSITRDTAALWRFESLVTTSDDIDWRILTFMERAPGSTLL